MEWFGRFCGLFFVLTHRANIQEFPRWKIAFHYTHASLHHGFCDIERACLYHDQFATDCSRKRSSLATLQKSPHFSSLLGYLYRSYWTQLGSIHSFYANAFLFEQHSTFFNQRGKEDRHYFYDNWQMHFTSQNGVLSSIPYAAEWAVTVATGALADLITRKKYMSKVNMRRFFNTIGALGPALGLLWLSFVDCDRTMAVVALSVAVGLSGAVSAGFFVSTFNRIIRLTKLGPRQTWLSGLLVGFVNRSKTATVKITTFYKPWSVQMIFLQTGQSCRFVS